MNPKRQDILPTLQREVGTHHPSTSIAAILSILNQAELGNLVSQAELFSDMEERDAHIYAEMTKRKLAVAQLDWSLAAPRDAGAREKKDIANLDALIEDSLDIDTLIFDMADAIGHGFSAQEIQWQRNGAGLWMPASLKPRPQRWFTVDIATRQQIRLRDNTIDGAELVRYGWLLHQHSSKTGYPATQGLYRALALPYLFKNFATKNWLRFCEMYAIPIRVLFHHEKDEGKKQELMSALGAMGINGVALLEGGTQDDLKTVDAAKGEGQGFQALIDWCERSVSKAILGGTLTSQADGKSSTNALGKVHDDARYQIRDHDAKQIANTLTQQLLGAIIAVNGLSIRPKWVFDTQEPEDLALYADALPKMVAVGMKIPARYAYEKLKIPMPEGDEDVLALPAPAQVALPAPAGKTGMAALSATLSAPQFTPDQQVIEDLADSVLNALNSPIDPAVIASAIRAAKDPQDLEERLAAVLAGADVSEFSQTLERALFCADVLGYAHAG